VKIYLQVNQLHSIKHTTYSTMTSNNFACIVTATVSTSFHIDRGMLIVYRYFLLAFCQICLKFLTYRQQNRSTRNGKFARDVQAITNFMNV